MTPSPLQLFADRRVELQPDFCGDIAHYAVMAAYGGRIAVNPRSRFNKRLKSVHRCTIADTRGPLRLTVPIEKPASLSAACWGDIIISGHDDWPRLFVTALESAYGRTPFYEFYADRFTPLILGAVGRHLLDFNRDMSARICNILGFALSDDPSLPAEPPAIELDAATLPRYWQVRETTLGFIPGLSILDLVFNLGPEAQLYLHRILASSPRF